MNRHREIQPWGFSAGAWQALALVLLGILALTNAAWFYNVRVVRAEAAASAPEPRQTERVIYQTPDGRPVAGPGAYPAPTPAAPAQRRQRGSVHEQPLASDEHCIDGTRFRVDGSNWTQNGAC
ncbi:hypothetical protein GCM10011394_13890 [Luteimonas terricola]|uniref:DUF4124 domain-containing protein n=1 Tax=Luteimonas terricola TaxID=645597 RepID=A0ABQ2EBY5_9GAMM|nr:hypothetical protein GCM10011394_13890 [Luteimonas terricola]